jgi:O-antigen/teichoic acid export membrane protein
MKMNKTFQRRANWLKNIGSLSVLRIFEYLLPLVTLPIVVRVLGPEIYGKWVYAQTVIGFYALAASLGLIVYGQREIAAHPEKTRELVPSILSLRLVLSLMTFVILIGSLIFLKTDRITQWLILLLGLSLIISSLCSLDWIFTGLQRFDKISILQVLSQVIYAGGIIIFLRRPNTVWILPVLTCIGSFTAGFVGWRWLKKEGVRFSIFFTPGQWWIILRVSLYYSFASSMSLIYNKADHLILAWLKGDYALGQYGACYRLMGALMGFILVGISVFAPYAVAVHSQTPERFRLILHKGLLLLCAISLPIAAGSVMFSNHLISLILGPKYLESSAVFSVLALVIPLGVSASFFAGSLLFAPGHHRRYAAAVTVGAIANMLLNVLLIPSMGAMGAALATVFAQGAVTAASIYMGRQYLDGVFNRSLLHPFGAILVMVLVLTVLAPFEFNIAIRVALGALSYAVSLWILDRKDGQELRDLFLSSIGYRKVPTVMP